MEPFSSSADVGFALASVPELALVKILAGLVSGIADHSNAVAIAAAPAKIRKPSEFPRLSKIKPVTPVLI